MSGILSSSYWVIENKILGVRKPESSNELNELKEIGMGGIITLLDDTENHDLYIENEIDFKWLPVKGGEAPSVEQVLEASKFAQDIWKSSKALVVHCSGGRKRTATMIAAILLKNNETLEGAVQLIKNANPDIQLSVRQLSFLKEISE